MVYGYCRISTAKQNIDRQVRNIKEKYQDAIIVKETYTGTKYQGRKELIKLLKMIKEDDILVFDSVSRMSRDADDGFRLYQELFKRNISLVFLKEPHINTETYKHMLRDQISVDIATGHDVTDEFMKSILAALNQYILRLAGEQIRLAFEQAEKEIRDLHQRTKEGIFTARLKGKQIGQKQGNRLKVKKEIPSKEKIKKYNKTFGGQLDNKSTWEFIGISKVTFYKYKKEIMDEMERQEEFG